MSRLTYAELGDACAAAHGMELIGGRWSYPILRELMFGPKRFRELLGSVRGITPAVLSSRLQEMSAAGLVQPGESEQSYALTPWAARLAPILRDIGRWALGSPVRSAQGGLTPDAVVQAMITMAGPDPKRALGGLQLHLRDDRDRAPVEYSYRIQWDRAGVRAERNDDRRAETRVRCDSSTWGRILFAGQDVADNAEISGNVAAVGDLMACFGGVEQAPNACPEGDAVGSGDRGAARNPRSAARDSARKVPPTPTAPPKRA